jgi:hypothetical protein
MSSYEAMWRPGAWASRANTPVLTRFHLSLSLIILALPIHQTHSHYTIYTPPCTTLTLPLQPTLFSHNTPYTTYTPMSHILTPPVTPTPSLTTNTLPTPPTDLPSYPFQWELRIYKGHQLGHKTALCARFNIFYLQL